MNDQSQMMNHAQMMTVSQQQMMNQAQVMNQPQILNQPQLMNPTHMMAQSQAMNQQPHVPQPQLMKQPQMLMNQSLPPMLNRSYKVWPQPQLPVDANRKYQSSLKPNFLNPKQSKQGRSNWKGKKVADNRKDHRRMEKPLHINTALNGPGNVGGYKPPTLQELQSQNRLKARKFYPKKKYNNRFAPYAPRNTTSFLIRAKKAGGITSLVSPCPVTPAVLPTPIFSPSREILGDMAKEEWGVDGYGSMKGLIRLRSPGNEAELHDEEEEEEGGGSSESDVEEHVEVERRLDHDLSRFEMIYPSYGVEYNNVLENRVDDQDSHIAQLEEENLTLKERLFLMDRELSDLRRRLQFLERQNQAVEDVNEEVVENESENGSEGESDAPEIGGEDNAEMAEYASKNVENRNDKVDPNENNVEVVESEGTGDVFMEDCVQGRIVAEDNKVKDEQVINEDVLQELTTDDDVNEQQERPDGHAPDGLAPDEATVKGKEVMVGDITNNFLTDEGIAKENVKDEKKQNEFVPELITKENEPNDEETRNNFSSYSDDSKA